MKSVHKNTHGAGKLVFFLVLLVIAGVGFAAWRLLREEKHPTTHPSQQSTTTIPCVSSDKTLCKFISGWEPSTSYRFIVRETTDGATTTSTYEYDLNGPDKIHTTVDGDPSYEVITIGNTIYTKAGGVWWKEVVKQTSSNKSSSSSSHDNTKDFAAVKPTQYSASGKEACGKLHCYKYKVNDPGNPDTEEFIWFDNQDYKLRKLSFENADTTSEQTYEYVKVHISEPSPVKTLGANQKITPGTAGPVSN